MYIYLYIIHARGYMYISMRVCTYNIHIYRNMYIFIYIYMLERAPASVRMLEHAWSTIIYM